jgi:hypothetical protein
MAEFHCPDICAAIPMPCPRQYQGGCVACKEDLVERSALIQYGGAASSRAEADMMARQQAVSSMPGQRPLIG